MPRPPESSDSDKRVVAARELLGYYSGEGQQVIEDLLALIKELDERVYNYWEQSMGEDL